MKLSLNQGAVEQKIVRGERINESIYIDNYFNEYATIGRKEFSLKERELLKSGGLIEIKKDSTRFENFILKQVSQQFEEVQELQELQKIQKSLELQESDKFVQYKRMISFINSKNRKCIEKSKYDEVFSIVNGFISLYNLKDNNKDLCLYINDFALIVIYIQEMYYRTRKYEDKVGVLVGESQKIDIRNFFSELLSSNGIDIKKIVINYNRNENLVLNSPIIIKLLLYEFGVKYFSVIERLDKNNWENELPKFIEKKKSGIKVNSISKYLETIIRVYFDFINYEELLVKCTIEQKFHLIGRLLTLGGFDAYNEEVEFKKDRIGYQSEKDFYDQRLKKYWPKKRTK